MQSFWHAFKQHVNNHWQLHWLLIVQTTVLLIGIICGFILLQYGLDSIEVYHIKSLEQAQATEHLVHETLDNTVQLHITAKQFLRQLQVYKYEIQLLHLDPDHPIEPFQQAFAKLQEYHENLRQLSPMALIYQEMKINEENLLILQVIKEEVKVYKADDSIAELAYLYEDLNLPMANIENNLAKIQQKLLTHSEDVYKDINHSVSENLLNIKNSSQAIDFIEEKIIIAISIFALIIVLMQLLFNYLLHYRLQLIANYSDNIANNIQTKIPILAADYTGHLSQNLYEMSQRIHKNRTEIENLNKSLEQKVQKRTTELQHANEELQATNEELLSTNDELYSALDSIVLAEKQLQEEVNEHKQTQVLLRAAMMEADEARLQAEQASKAKSEFLANMSHEIRTPMNAILGFTEILLNKVEDPQYIHYLATINASGKTLMSLLNDVLDLSKVEAGKFNLEYTATNPHSILQEIYDMFADKITAKKLDFIIDLDEVVPTRLMLDEIRFRQILLNLLSNALKFTDAGYIKIIISCQFLDEQHVTLKIQVQDTGVGIAENQHSIIFQAFEQQSGQSHAKYGGTGLGLTITKRLVEMMQGKIFVTSQLGQGSTFTVVMHSVQVANLPSEQHFQASGLDVHSINFAPAVVLIADDVMLNREVIETYLAIYSSLTLLHAEDGREAIQMAYEHQPDIILMDIKMPKMDGDAALHVLKQQSETAHIPIIAITASIFKQNDSRIYLFDDYLIKPIQQQQVVNALIQFLPYTLINPNDIAGAHTQLIAEDCQENINQLIDMLENEVFEEWQTFNQADFFDMNGINSLSQRVQQLAIEYHCPPLQAWAEKLYNQVSVFDMGKLPITLQQFPEIIKKLKQDSQAN